MMNWWHTIDLPDGITTPGRVDYRGEAGKRFMLPEDLTGKSVLDLGCWDGFWAIEAKKRGAAEVVAMDRCREQLENSKLALGAYGIEYYCSGDLDFPMGMGWKEGFDIVLFFGILYHLKNPTMGLWNARNCCKPGGLVIVESAVNQGPMAPLINEIPLLWVIDHVHHNDPSNYFMPNTSGLVQLCRLAGLEPIEGHDSPGEPHSRMTVKCQKPKEASHASS